MESGRGRLAPQKRRQMGKKVENGTGLQYWGKFVEVVSRLNKQQKEWVKQSGFYWLMNLKIHDVDNSFLKWLTCRWDRATQYLLIRDDYVVYIDADMVGKVTGLPFGDTTYNFSPVSENDEELIHIKQTYGNGYGNGICFEEVKRKCVKETKDIVKFMQHFILYALGTVLCTVSSNSISDEHCKVIKKEFVSRASSWNWSQYVLDWMVRNSTNDASTRTVGSAVVLLIIYLDRIKIGDMPVNWNTMEPRIAAFDTMEVERLITADRMKNGQYGRGKIIRNVIYGEEYPPSNVSVHDTKGCSFQEKYDIGCSSLLERVSWGTKRSRYTQLSDSEEYSSDNYSGINQIPQTPIYYHEDYKRIRKKVVEAILDKKSTTEEFRDHVLFRFKDIVTITRGMLHTSFNLKGNIMPEVMTALSVCINESFLSKYTFDRDELVICPIWELHTLPKEVLILKTMRQLTERGANLKLFRRFIMPIFYKERWCIYIVDVVRKKFRAWDTGKRPWHKFHQELFPVVRSSFRSAFKDATGIKLGCENWSFKGIKHLPKESRPEYSGLYVIIRLLSMVKSSKSWLEDLEEYKRMYRNFMLAHIIYDEVNEMLDAIWDLQDE